VLLTTDGERFNSVKESRIARPLVKTCRLLIGR
jgi:hypothetical protein